MQYTSTQAQNEQLPVQHFDKIRHNCPIIEKSFLAFPPDFCKLRDIKEPYTTEQYDAFAAAAN